MNNAAPSNPNRFTYLVLRRQQSNQKSTRGPCRSFNALSPPGTRFTILLLRLVFFTVHGYFNTSFEDNCFTFLVLLQPLEEQSNQKSKRGPRSQFNILSLVGTRFNVDQILTIPNLIWLVFLFITYLNNIYLSLNVLMKKKHKLIDNHIITISLEVLILKWFQPPQKREEVCL